MIQLLFGRTLNVLDLSGSISDNLYFYSAAGNGYMVFTSIVGGGALADTGVTDFGFNGATEAANETFTYVAGGGDPSTTNFYNGVSGVPETSTWAMMLAGFAGLGFVGYRRNKLASVAA